MADYAFAVRDASTIVKWRVQMGQVICRQLVVAPLPPQLCPLRRYLLQITYYRFPRLQSGQGNIVTVNECHSNRVSLYGLSVDTKHKWDPPEHAKGALLRINSANRERKLSKSDDLRIALFPRTLHFFSDQKCLMAK